MQDNRRLYIGLFAGIVVLLGWQQLVNTIWPPKPPLPPQETAVALGGGAVVGTDPAAKMRRAVPRLVSEAEPKPEEKKAEPVAAAVANVAPPEFIALGTKESKLQVLLTTRGGAVQQVVLPDFKECNREGLEVRLPDGSAMTLHLVPGYVRGRGETIRADTLLPYPELKPGVPDAEALKTLAPPSYVLFHYAQPKDERPLDTLGTRDWKVVARSEDRVVFETELAEPQNIRIRKIFTLGKGDYHVGLKVEIDPLEGAKPPKGFRYQIVGANHLPLEGEWYSTTFRTAIVGFVNGRGRARRDLFDAATLRLTEGSDRLQRVNDADPRNSDNLAYAGTMIQYFSSVLCVDNEQESGQKRNFVEYVRCTPIGPPKFFRDKRTPMSFLDDVTIRAISEELKVDAPVRHNYLLYHGPVKVRLLKQLRGDQAVDPSLVDRYIDDLRLNLMTDAPMPNFFGRFASAIGWSDIVVGVTNIVHSLIGFFHTFLPLAICIACVTIIVRGLLFPLSRKQTISQQIMQAKMARIAPQVKELQEKCGNDFQKFNQEKTKLMLSAGVNPATMMGGCLLVFLQMPIFMGLYYALQESIFFRLNRFLWMPNLAAPDMLVWWTESIPMISDPDSLGSGLYMGPYFNILPIIAVSLMMYQQKRMMPPALTEQDRMQQKTMKFMMILFAFFFYKVAAGLCIYFIAGSTWSLIEKKFMPKFHKDENGIPQIPERYLKKKKEAKEMTGWRAKLRDRMKEVMEQAEKQQAHKRDPRDNRGDRDNKGGKKKR